MFIINYICTGDNYTFSLDIWNKLASWLHKYFIHIIAIFCRSLKIRKSKAICKLLSNFLFYYSFGYQIGLISHNDYLYMLVRVGFNFLQPILQIFKWL